MTDAEHAAVLRGFLDPGENLSRLAEPLRRRAAIERAIELLETERGVYFRYLCTNGHHTVSRKDDLTTCSAKTMTWSCHAPMVPYDGDEVHDG